MHYGAEILNLSLTLTLYYTHTKVDIKQFRC